MPSARSNPLDSNPPGHRRAPKSRVQNQDAPGQRLIFLVLLRTMLGIAMAHAALGGPDRDRIIGLIRALIDRLEQQRPPTPSTDPAQDTQHPRIIAATGRRLRRTPDRTRWFHAEPSAPPMQAPHCASANQVRGPPPHPSQHHRPVISRKPHPAATSLLRCPPHRRLAAQRVAPA
jgi:hypothetical protein